MTMANPNLIVAWTADKLPADPFSEDVETRREQWRKNLAGIEVIKSWLLLGNGTLVDVCGTDGVMEVVPSSLDDLKRVADQYIQTVGFTLSIGVGNDMADAERARLVAKHRGGDRMMLWSDELYPELAAAQDSSGDGEFDEYGDFLGRSETLADVWTEEDFVELAKMTRQPLEQLLKSDFSQDEMNALETPMSGGQSAPAFARAGSPPEQPSEGASPGGGDVPPDAQTASQAPENNLQGAPAEPQTHEDAFHAHAQAADADDQASQSPQRQQIKQAVVQVLRQVAPQLKQLEAVKDQAPDAYEGVLAVIEAMAAMAQALNGEEPAVPEPEQEEGGEGESEGGGEEKAEKSEDEKVEESPECDDPECECHLKKDGGIPAKRAGIHHHLNLPVGSTHNGQIKVLHPETGKTSWKSVRAGIVQSPDGHATSSRNPNGK